MNGAIAILARAPSSGGKSRLAPHVPEPRLASLRAALLADTLDVVFGFHGVDAFVFFTPEGGEREIAALVPRPLTLVAQRGDDLGARMLAAFHELIVSRGYRWSILVGSDVPLLTTEHVFEATDTLRRNGGVVVGPADDGGYYLIGMTEIHELLFDRIAWGSDSVLLETLRRADRLGVDVRIIRGAYDIDTIEDLRRVENDLATEPPERARHLRRWFAAS
jgi:rSAM/selenodomain-associated transferase 1